MLGQGKNVMRTAFGVLLLALAPAVASCDEDDPPEAARGNSLAEKLTRSLLFPQAMLLNDKFPPTTDPRSMLLPLGPTAVVAPEQSSIMAFELRDPDERPVKATLMQFEDAESYWRIPPPEDGGGSVVIENTVTGAEDLCEGLCDAIFTVTVREAVELEGGAVSAVSEREIVIDCREQGDHAACGEDLGGVELLSSLPCGDVTQGEAALAADRTLDAHLEAVRVTSFAIANVEQGLSAIRRSLSMALGIDKDSDADTITGALTERIGAATSSGVTLLLAERGCGLRRVQVLHALGSCDPDAAAGKPELTCTGLCQATDQAARGCEAEAMGGCRGLLEGAACAGECVGACQSVLDEPSECAGTCVGTCDGSCPGDGKSCAGPCDGLCSGECRALSEGECAGQCTGLCDELVDGAPACMAPLAAYCSGPPDTALACAGDCFGSAELPAGSALCQPSALAVGQALPRCEPALAQLSFGFAPELSSDEQSAFAELVDELSAPVSQLTELLGRIDLLEAAGAGLLSAGEGAIAGYLASEQASRPDDPPLACAARRIPEANTWLAGRPDALTALREEALQLLSVVSDSDP